MKTTQHVRDERLADLALYFPGTPAYEARIAEIDAECARLVASMDIGYVYVIEFASGVVKVGKSTNPAQRLATHAQMARAHGGSVSRRWASQRHFRCGDTERTLLKRCAEVGTLAAGREYFHAPYREIRSLASLLATNAPQADDELMAEYESPDHDQFGVPSRLSELVTERFARRDRDRREYLERLIAAAGDDLSMTWQQAHELLPDAEPIGASP